MQSCSALSPTAPIQSDVAHETMYTAKVAGKDLDHLIAAGVLQRIGAPVLDRPGVTWSIAHRSETISTERTQQIAEVTIVVDHRTDAGNPATAVQVRSGDVVVLPSGHY